MTVTQFDRIIGNIGYVTRTDFFLKFVAPVMITAIIFSVVINLFLDFLPSYYGYLIFFLAIAFVVVYPYGSFEKKKVDINEKMHLMITYVGTISTLDIQRRVLFTNLSEKKENFGEIAKISEKILYLAKSWNIGFSNSARKIGSIVPSQMFSDFLDRFAIMMDFGEDLKTFLMDEQDAVMDDFSTEYKKALESIKFIQEIFISLTITIAFVMSVSLLLPLIAGYPMERVVQYSLLAVVIMDVFLYVFVKSFVPSDQLVHDLPIKDKEMRDVRKFFYILTPASVLLSLILLYYNFFPFLFNIAIGITPLLVVGVLAQNHEKIIFQRDKAFPSYIRALGSAVEVKMGAVIGSLRNLQVHDFGVLNQMSINIYRRLRLGCDKYGSWMLFAAESGSYLIAKFSQIFAEGVYMGGNAEKIGEICSKNFNKIISLRKERIQLSSSVRGAFYGSLIGFAAASYTTAKITELLSVIFSSPFSSLKGTDSYMTSMVSSIVPTSALSINFEQVAVYIGIMIIIHSIVSALIIKLVEGGNNYALLFDLIIMLWLGAVLSWVLPWLIDKLLPGLTSSVGVDAAASVGG